MDTFIRYIKLPISVRGFTIPDENGNYNIYINKNLSQKMQQNTYFHEITHIENNDFEKQEPIKVIENRVKYEDQRR